MQPDPKPATTPAFAGTPAAANADDTSATTPNWIRPRVIAPAGSTTPYPEPSAEFLAAVAKVDVDAVIRKYLYPEPEEEERRTDPRRGRPPAPKKRNAEGVPISTRQAERERVRAVQAEHTRKVREALAEEKAERARARRARQIERGEIDPAAEEQDFQEIAVSKPPPPPIDLEFPITAYPLTEDGYAADEALLMIRRRMRHSTLMEFLGCVQPDHIVRGDAFFANSHWNGYWWQYTPDDGKVIGIPLRYVTLVNKTPEAALTLLYEELGVVVRIKHRRNGEAYAMRVDRDDAGRVLAESWTLMVSSSDPHPRVRQTTRGGQLEQPMLNQFVVGLPSPGCVRFLDGDTMNYTRLNLRAFHSRREPYGQQIPAAALRGVTYNPTTDRWNVRRFEQRGAPHSLDLGSWPSLELATLIYHVDVARDELDFTL